MWSQILNYLLNYQKKLLAMAKPFTGFSGSVLYY